MGEYAPDNIIVLLAGRAGAGKSKTGNSIIEADVFDVMPSSDCVAMSCRLLETFHDRGLTVIDTPGSFDASVEAKVIGLESRVHAVLFVVSLGTRFSAEDVLVFENLVRFYGAALSHYMIVVFTHGDVGDESLDDYLGPNCHEQLAKILEMCGNRFVIFDNATKDNFEKYQQREDFLRLVDEVVASNNGLPYTYEENQWDMNDKHFELKPPGVSKNEVTEVEPPAVSENGSKFDMAYYEDQLVLMESKHHEMTLKLEKQLEEEKIARLQAEAAQIKSNEEISVLRGDLERGQEEARKLQKTHKESMKLLKKKMKEKYQKKNIAIEQQIEAKVGEAALRLENQLVEKFVRMQEDERKSSDEIRKLREDMDRVQIYTGETFQKFLLRMGDEHQLRERILELERQLADEQACRNQAEVKAQEVEKKADDEISKLREDEEDMHSKFRERIHELQQMLADEQAAQMQAAAETEKVEKKANVEISKLREDLVKAQRDVEELRKKSLMNDVMALKSRKRVMELGKMLANEQDVRIKAEVRMEEAETKANVEISKLRMDLEMARREAEMKRDELFNLTAIRDVDELHQIGTWKWM